MPETAPHPMPVTITEEIRGYQAATEALLVEKPLTVINRGLDLNIDEHGAAYVNGYLQAARVAAVTELLLLTAAIDQAGGF